MTLVSLPEEILSQMYASLAELAAHQRKAGESDKSLETKSLMAACQVALAGPKEAPVTSSSSNEETARKEAWELLKPELGTKNWSVSEHFNFGGFFNWGWRAAMHYQPTLEKVAYESFQAWWPTHKFSDVSGAKLPLYHLDDIKDAFEAGASTGARYSRGFPQGPLPQVVASDVSTLAES